MRRGTAALIAVAMSSGCSVMFLEGPRQNVRVARGQSRAWVPGDPCTTSPLAPIADAIAATAITGVTVAALASSPPTAAPGAGEGILIMVVGAVLFGTSAIGGFASIWECRQIAARPPEQDPAAAPDKPSSLWPPRSAAPKDEPEHVTTPDGHAAPIVRPSTPVTPPKSGGGPLR